MKRAVLILIVCMLAGAATELQAQNLKRFVSKKSDTAGEAAGERLDKESDTIVNKGVNKGIDKLKGKFFGTSGSSSQSGQNSGESGSDTGESNSDEGNTSAGTNKTERSSSSGNLFGKSLMSAMGMSTEVNAKEMYEFDTYMKMRIENREQDGSVDEMIYDTYNSRESMSYAMVFNDNNGMSTIIFDTDNNLMLTLSESGDEKTGFAITFDADSLEEEMQTDAEDYDKVAEDNPYNKYRTGKTKTIIGYKCEEYLMEDDSIETHIWVTDELNRQLQKDVIKNSVFGGLFLYADYMNGMVMEYDIKDKSTDERILMTVTDLDLNHKHSISTRGYSIFSMTGVPDE